MSRRALFADLELTALHSLTDDALKQIEMDAGEAMQSGLHSRRNGPEHSTERAAGTHPLALTVNDAERVAWPLRLASWNW
jgi:hypothetical protein